MPEELSLKSCTFNIWLCHSCQCPGVDQSANCWTLKKSRSVSMLRLIEIQWRQASVCVPHIWRFLKGHIWTGVCCSPWILDPWRTAHTHTHIHSPLSTLVRQHMHIAELGQGLHVHRAMHTSIYTCMFYNSSTPDILTEVIILCLYFRTQFTPLNLKWHPQVVYKTLNATDTCREYLYARN